MGSRSTFHARLLDPVDLESWDRLAGRYGTIFDTIAWIDLFIPGTKRYGIYDAGNNLRGGFVAFEERRFGFKVLRNPPFTPQVGPFYEPRAENPAARTTEQRAVVEAMAGCLSGSDAAIVSVGLSLGVDDCLPFFWRGYKVITHYTYRMDLLKSEQDLLAGMSVDRRNDIRKAQKDGIVTEEISGTGPLRSLVLDTFARQNMAFPPQDMNRILAAYPPGTFSYGFISKIDNQPMAGAYVVHDSRVAYYIMGGYTANAHHGSGALAMYHAILKAKSMGLEVFDFEGSVIPPIEKYFRGFGGRLTPLFRVNKAWLPLEMGLKLIKRGMF